MQIFYTYVHTVTDTILNQIHVVDNSKIQPWRVWELILVRIDNSTTPSSSSVIPRNPAPLPPYEGNTGNRSCACSHTVMEPGDDGFGTTVIEVTTVTTRKKYRLEDRVRKMRVVIYALVVFVVILCACEIGVSAHRHL